jgi:hypothetical protein
VWHTPNFAGAGARGWAPCRVLPGGGPEMPGSDRFRRGRERAATTHELSVCASVRVRGVRGPVCVPLPSVRVARGLARPVRLAPGFSVTSSSALSIGKSVIAEEALHAGIWAAAIHLQGQSKYEQINLARSVSALRFILRRRIGGRDPASCASASMNRAGAAGSVTGGPQRPGGDVMRQGHHRRAGATQWIGIGLKRAMKRPCINCRGLPAARPNERRCSSH